MMKIAVFVLFVFVSLVAAFDGWRIESLESRLAELEWRVAAADCRRGDCLEFLARSFCDLEPECAENLLEEWGA